MQVLIVSLVAYIFNSAYYIFGTSSDQIRSVSSWALTFLYMYLSCNIIYNVIVNIKSIRAQSSAIDDPSMREIRSGFTKKIIMFILFALCMVSYYTFHSAFLVAVPMLQTTDKDYEYIGGIHAVVSMITIACMVNTFHPCFFTASFQLGQQQPVNVVTNSSNIGRNG